MTAVWAYPWTFNRDTIDTELESLSDAGVDSITIAGHYHSIQTLVPRTAGEALKNGVFESYPGGCHFDPDSRYFDDTDINPPIIRSETNGQDSFGRITSAAADHHLNINAWTVCLHNSRLGAENPQYRVESAFGDARDHALCPSHPEVRTYYERIVRSLRDYNIARIDLESIGFPTAFHGHGHQFGHLKNHVVTSDSGRWLLSQCFCDGCRAAATDYEVEFDAAQTLVREMAHDALRGTTSELPPLDELINSHKEIQSLLSFRAGIVEQFISQVVAASGPVPLNYYLADGLGYLPKDVEWAGVKLDQLAEYLDSVTALCYTASPETARKRVQAARSAFGGHVHAGVTLDPEVIENEDTFSDVVTASRNTATGQLNIYNYSLLGDEQVDWLENAV